MNKTALITVLVLLVALAGCGEKATTTTRESAETTTPATTAKAARTDAADVWNGTITETMNSGGYTYALVDTGSEQVWVAAPETPAAVGQKVTVPKGMLMENFSSKTLDRVFDAIYFVGGIYPEGGLPSAASGAMGKMPMDANHAGGGVNENTKVADAAVEDVAKAAGGYTIEEIFAKGAELNGQTVKVRGRVVKFTANIMGTNWVHIQDNTPGDLTVTTDAKVATGDVVVVEGVLAANKDFGAGYRYEAIIEKATVTK